MEIWKYKYRRKGERVQLRELNRTDTVMAPTISGSMICTGGENSLTNKLRKPIVEKIRRERINNSIEKLKSLLSEEFLKQQPDSRQEKADILEMTVDFLRQRSQNPSVCSPAASEGYSRCVQETVTFLSQCQVQTQSHRRLLKIFLNMQPSTEKNTSVLHQLNSTVCQSSSTEKTPACCQLWRPW